jgi:hypothetical protein
LSDDGENKNNKGETVTGTDATTKGMNDLKNAQIKSLQRINNRDADLSLSIESDASLLFILCKLLI